MPVPDAALASAGSRPAEVVPVRCCG